mgnify:CR=1 FL=1
MLAPYLLFQDTFWRSKLTASGEITFEVGGHHSKIVHLKSFAALPQRIGQTRDILGFLTFPTVLANLFLAIQIHYIFL